MLLLTEMAASDVDFVSRFALRYQIDEEKAYTSEEILMGVQKRLSGSGERLSGLVIKII